MTYSMKMMQSDKEDHFLRLLEEYRREIDAIDCQILTLLATRLQVVEKVGALKEAHGVQGSYIRPAREALMLRHLLKEAERLAIPSLAVGAIWRIIIGAATAHESPLNVVLFKEDKEGSSVATAYFSASVMQHTLSENDIWGAACLNEHSIFVLPYDKKGQWWRTMPEGWQIFACLPFVGKESPTHVAVGMVAAEETGEDCSLFYDATCEEVVTIKGYMQKHPEMSQARFLGAFALPYH